MAQKFIKLLSNNLAEAEGRLLDIAYQSVRQRVAGTLLKLSGKADLVTVVRRDISSLVATATESLNRTLADFKDEGLIDLLPDGIRILNGAKLEKVVRL